MVQKINPHPALGHNRSPPYYVYSKDAILGSVPSISSEILALVQCTTKQCINFVRKRSRTSTLSQYCNSTNVYVTKNAVSTSAKQNRSVMYQGGGCTVTRKACKLVVYYTQTHGHSFPLKTHKPSNTHVLVSCIYSVPDRYLKALQNFSFLFGDMYVYSTYK